MTDARKKILAVITARGGSKRVPQKNIKLLCGKPLIAYSIEAAKQSRYVDRVVVSTDDEKISKVSKEYGAEVVRRPDELAQDKSPTSPVLQQVVNFLEDSENYRPDLLLLLQPTSPLRSVQHVDEMIEKYFAGDYDSMLSVEFLHNRRFDLDEKDQSKLVKAFENDLKERKPVIIENGALYLSEIGLIKRQQIVGDKVGYYAMDRKTSLDIDEHYDFVIAEQLLLMKKNNE